MGVQLRLWYESDRPTWTERRIAKKAITECKRILAEAMERQRQQRRKA